MLMVCPWIVNHTVSVFSGIQKDVDENYFYKTYLLMYVTQINQKSKNSLFEIVC